MIPDDDNDVGGEEEDNEEYTPPLPLSAFVVELLTDVTFLMQKECKTFLKTKQVNIKSRVPHQNGVSQVWYIVGIHHSGRKPFGLSTEYLYNGIVYISSGPLAHMVLIRSYVQCARMQFCLNSFNT